LSAYLTAANQLRTARIVSVKDETPTTKSFTLPDKLGAKASPGQFVMIWIPGVDEVPMSLSAIDSKEGNVTITVEEVGEATSHLHRMKLGDVVGLRGPFGRGYTLTRARNIMIVGGGTGLASLASLTEKMAPQKGRRITLLLGAKTRSELLFLERLKALLGTMNHRMVVTTEDGSYGTKGLVSEPVEHLLKEEKFETIYACGPEMMMHRMFLLAERYKVPFQASLERLMRCAIGLCGTCVIGKYRVCRDGPVFSGEQLREVKDEFGHFRRGFNSRKIAI
jgi:dihydroorotate dehydrogenase electron transfer subunit